MGFKNPEYFGLQLQLQYVNTSIPLILNICVRDKQWYFQHICISHTGHACIHRFVVLLVTTLNITPLCASCGNLSLASFGKKKKKTGKIYIYRFGIIFL